MCNTYLTNLINTDMFARKEKLFKMTTKAEHQ